MPASAPNSLAQSNNSSHSDILADGPGATVFAITTAAAARTRVEEAIAKRVAHDDVKLSPCLTTAWPPTKPALLFVAYPLEPNPSRIDEYKVGRPYAAIVDLRTGEVRIDSLPRSHNLKKITESHEPHRIREGLARAEQAMVELLLGERAATHSRMALDGYREWFNAHLDITTDLTRRYPRSMRWFRSPATQAGGFELPESQPDSP
ncbi:MAG: hypothetical protein V3V08_13600 [Nannocystaceae bacterium]